MLDINQRHGEHKLKKKKKKVLKREMLESKMKEKCENKLKI